MINMGLRISVCSISGCACRCCSTLRRPINVRSNRDFAANFPKELGFDSWLIDLTSRSSPFSSCGSWIALAPVFDLAFCKSFWLSSLKGSKPILVNRVPVLLIIFRV